MSKEDFSKVATMNLKNILPYPTHQFGERWSSSFWEVENIHITWRRTGMDCNWSSDLSDLKIVADMKYIPSDLWATTVPGEFWSSGHFQFSPLMTRAPQGWHRFWGCPYLSNSSPSERSTSGDEGTGFSNEGERTGTLLISGFIEITFMMFGVGGCGSLQMINILMKQKFWLGSTMWFKTLHKDFCCCHWELTQEHNAYSEHTMMYPQFD